MGIGDWELGIGHWAKQLRVVSKEVKFTVHYRLNALLLLTAFIRGMGIDKAPFSDEIGLR